MLAQAVTTLPSAHGGPFSVGGTVRIGDQAARNGDQAESVFGSDAGGPDVHGDPLISIEDVQKALNRSRASVYRYTNTDPRNLNPAFNAKKLNPEYRTDQKDQLMFHPHEVARFARDVLRIKEVTVEVLNSPSTATQQLLGAILEELRTIRLRLDALDSLPAPLHRQPHSQARPAA